MVLKKPTSLGCRFNYIHHLYRVLLMVSVTKQLYRVSGLYFGQQAQGDLGQEQFRVRWIVVIVRYEQFELHMQVHFLLLSKMRVTFKMPLLKSMLTSVVLQLKSQWRGFQWSTWQWSTKVCDFLQCGSCNLFLDHCHLFCTSNTTLLSQDLISSTQCILTRLHKKAFVSYS